MKWIIEGAMIALLLLTIIIPGLYYIREKSPTRAKKALYGNLFCFFGALILFSATSFGVIPALAETTEEAATAASSTAQGWGYLGAALAVGMSGIGGGIAVASSASAALGAISEDSSVLGKSLIFVGLSEGVCLYGFIVALMILGSM